MSSLVILFLVILPFMLVEQLRSSANIRMLKRRGAIEPPGDPYGAISVVYVGGFTAMALEGWWRGGAAQPWLLAGLVVFTLAKALKYYAVRTLGPFWSFRIFVVPGAPLVTGGPYRYLRHPNYVGIFGEFLGAALMMHGPIAGAVTAIAFYFPLRKRLIVEEGALGLRKPGRIE